MLQLANFGPEYVKAWRADRGFWNSVPLDNYRWKERGLIEVIPSVKLLIGLGNGCDGMSLG